MPRKNIFSLNLILYAYYRSGDFSTTQDLFLASPPNSVPFLSPRLLVLPPGFVPPSPPPIQSLVVLDLWPEGSG
ncbi:hypothetical protein E2562_027121 [Oryza meyeriana var. granulata]|uniref:Uncharacterized protein n=1 Tax=Oryza meyeriana var. granulata TaxID=110450 RepID=A0A6G1EPY3_9ORYZ|nr:hypothetical protein E2562_027121 [Oryza meyeriana var. granulata]